MVQGDQVRELKISSEKSGLLINYLADQLPDELLRLKAKLETITNPKHRFARGLDHLKPLVQKCGTQFDTLIQETSNIKTEASRLKTENKKSESLPSKKYAYDTSSINAGTPPAERFYHHKRTGSGSAIKINTLFFINYEEILESIMSIRTKLETLSDKLKAIDQNFFKSPTIITKNNEEALTILSNIRSKLVELSYNISLNYFPIFHPKAHKNMKQIECSENLAFLVIPQAKATALKIKNAIKEFLSDSRLLHTAFIAWADTQMKEPTNVWVKKICDSIPENDISKLNIDNDVLTEQTDQHLFNYYLENLFVKFKQLNEFHLYIQAVTEFLSHQQANPAITFRKELLQCYEAMEIIICNVEQFETMESFEKNNADLMIWLRDHSQLLNNSVVILENCLDIIDKNSAVNLIDSTNSNNAQASSMQKELNLADLKGQIKFAKKFFADVTLQFRDHLLHVINENPLKPSASMQP